MKPLSPAQQAENLFRGIYSLGYSDAGASKPYNSDQVEPSVLCILQVIARESELAVKAARTAYSEPTDPLAEPLRLGIYRILFPDFIRSAKRAGKAADKIVAHNPKEV